jgi:uncharacterized membrane protein YciS (DUF1049 family)
MALEIAGFAFVFVQGFLLGALVMNEVVWRKQRRELLRLKRDIEADRVRWAQEEDEMRRENQAIISSLTVQR